MKTSNAMQLKVLINNREKAAGVSPQLMLQNCMLEQLIDRELSVWLALWRGVNLNRRLLCRRWGWNKSLDPHPIDMLCFLNNARRFLSMPIGLLPLVDAVGGCEIEIDTAIVVPAVGNLNNKSVAVIDELDVASLHLIGSS